MAVGQMVERMAELPDASPGSSATNIGFDAVSGAAYGRDPNVRDIDYGIPGWLIQQPRSHSRMPVIV